MRHGYHILSGIDSWPIAGAILIVAFLLGTILWLVHRWTVASDGLTPGERKSLPYPQREILSMLRQHGGPMMQTEMADMMPIDPEDLASALKSMEAGSLIHRRWDLNSSTYMVSTNAWAESDTQGKVEPNGI